MTGTAPLARHCERSEAISTGEIAAEFLAAVLSRPRVKALMSDEHFSVGGRQITELWVLGDVDGVKRQLGAAATSDCSAA